MILHKVRISVVIATIVLLMLPFRASTAPQQSEAEQAIKTAIVFKLLRFVSWPDYALENSDTLNICLSRKEPFYPAFKEIEGAAIGDRFLNVVVIAKRMDQNCHAVFASQASGFRPRDWRALIGGSVLTISDSDMFAERGGMINLVMRNNRVSFAVNVEAVEKADLQISALVLKLADITESNPNLSQINETSRDDS